MENEDNMSFSYDVANRVENAKDLTEIQREYCIGMVQILSAINAQLVELNKSIKHLLYIHDRN